MDYGLYTLLGYILAIPALILYLIAVTVILIIAAWIWDKLTWKSRKAQLDQHHQEVLERWKASQKKRSL